MARTLRSDRMLFVGALALVCTSVVMVVSASMARDSIAAASLKQLKFVAIGLVGMFAVMRTDYHHLRRPAVIWTLLGVTVVGLLAVFAFREVKGSHRWIMLPGLNMQPSELAKLAVIIFAGAVLERRMHRINDVKYALLPVAFVTGLLAFLIVAEPDLGTATVVVLIVMAMTVAAGLRWRHLMVAGLLMVPVVGAYVAIYPHARDRVMAYASVLRGAEPTAQTPQELADLKRVKYQGDQSLIALGSGGWFGVGLGASQQKNFYLPEANNDFIFAVIGEELGVVGTTALLACFMVVVWRGLRAALLAPDRFGTLVGIGLTMLVGIQALINMTVVTGIGPTKGIPLPLVSAGGSSLVVNMLAMGILLNISQHASVKAAATVDAA